MLFYIVCVLIIISDIVTKRLAVYFLSGVSTIPIIKDIVHFTYVENKGAAFGILQNHRWIFITLSIIIIAAILLFKIRNKAKARFLDLGLSFVLGGAVANLIDRIFIGYVIDFIDFRIIDFPVFNIADIFVVIGAIMLSIFYIFLDKDERK